MSRRPLIVLGIDALDWSYVEAHRDALPNLGAWPVLSPLAVDLPARLDPGVDDDLHGPRPGEHGYLDSIDYLDKQPDRPRPRPRASCRTAPSGTRRRGAG